jgi:hypothetical protein
MNHGRQRQAIAPKLAVMLCDGRREIHVPAVAVALEPFLKTD